MPALSPVLKGWYPLGDEMLKRCNVLQGIRSPALFLSSERLCEILGSRSYANISAFLQGEL